MQQLAGKIRSKIGDASRGVFDAFADKRKEMMQRAHSGGQAFHKMDAAKLGEFLKAEIQKVCTIYDISSSH